MGSHSPDAKRRKRKAQKKKRRAVKCKKRTGLLSYQDGNSSLTSEVSELSESAESSPPYEQESDSLCKGDDEEDLFAALDRIADRKERFWNEVDPEVKQLEDYRDPHPSIVIDQDRFIEVFVGGDNQDFRGLQRVSAEEYFSRIHRRETKAMSLCKILRNRIESLEKEIDNGRQKLVAAHKEKTRAVNATRYFWRNKIFEQQSYGGKMVLAALRRGNF